MSGTALLKKYKSEVELTSVAGLPNVRIILPKKAFTPEGQRLTDADWDKFEADIDEAFEQVP